MINDVIYDTDSLYLVRGGVVQIIRFNNAIASNGYRVSDSTWRECVVVALRIEAQDERRNAWKWRDTRSYTDTSRYAIHTILSLEPLRTGL